MSQSSRPGTDAFPPGRSICAVACGRHHGRRSGSDDRAQHHITRVVHPGVDSRVGHRTGEQPDRHCQPRVVPPHGIGERKGRRGVAGRERRGLRHGNKTVFKRGRVRALRASPMGERLDAEIHGRGRYADREHALERHPPPTSTAEGGDDCGYAEPQARVVRGGRELAKGIVQLRRGRHRHGLVHRAVYRPQLTQRLRPRGGCTPPALHPPREGVHDRFPPVDPLRHKGILDRRAAPL